MMLLDFQFVLLSCVLSLVKAATNTTELNVVPGAYIVEFEDNQVLQPAYKEIETS